MTLGELLDLIDKARESTEVIEIYDGSDGGIQMRGRVSSPLWEKLEDLEVENISAEAQGVIKVYLKDY